MARPRQFDEDTVLGKAMLLFWARGYEGTSTTELLTATGLTNSSLYQAFGSKEGLYRRVAERYRNGPLGVRDAALAEPTPRRVVERLLLATIDVLTGDATPRGCLDVNSGAGRVGNSASLQVMLVGNRAVIRHRLGRRLAELGLPRGLPMGDDPQRVAMLVATLLHGLAIHAADGVSAAELRSVVHMFLVSWPPDPNT